MRVMKKILLSVLLVLITGSPLVSAKSIQYAPYRSYQYNSEGKSTAAAAGYLPSRRISGSDLKLEKEVTGAAYLTVGKNGPDIALLYLIDGGRIIETDQSLHVKAVFDEFTDEDGRTVRIDGAKGVAGDRQNGILYIADTAHNQLLISDMTGRVKKSVSARSLGISSFTPYRVILTESGNLIVLDQNTAGGYYRFTAEGELEKHVALPGARLRDIYYDYASGKAFALDAGGIWDIDGGSRIPVDADLSGASSLTMDVYGEYFFIATGKTVLRVTSMGEAEPFVSCPEKIAALAYDFDKEYLLVSGEGKFGVGAFDGNGKPAYSITKLSFELNQPTDMFFDGKDRVYILDSVNARILELDKELTQVRNICSVFMEKTGAPLDITGSQGMYIYEEKLYIADTEHYWGVWHNKQPFTDYRKLFPRFMSEFGLQSFPLLKTVKSFTLPEDRNIFSGVMESHQKSGTSNVKILYYISETFKMPKNFDMLLYASELIQAEGMRYGIEHWRRNRGRCMGSIYWQLNDCWPVASWSSIDGLGRWKVLQYAARRFYAPVLASACEEGTAVSLHVTNESEQALEGTMSWKLLTADGNILKEGKQDAAVNAFSSAECVNLDFSDVLDTREKKRSSYLHFYFDSGNTVKSEGTVLFVKPKHFSFTDPALQIKAEEQQDRFILYVTADSFAKFVGIDLTDADAVFSDNYFDMSAGETKCVEILKDDLSCPLSLAQLDEQLTIRSLYDSFE